MQNQPMMDPGELARARDENEQLRTALEGALEENAKLVEERARLSQRLAEQARGLVAAHSAYARSDPEPAASEAADLAPDLRSQADEELRVAFEELQVLTEELEVANNSLMASNRELDERVEQRTRDLERANAATRASELRFRTLVEGMPQLVWRSAERGEWTWSSPQWSAYTGRLADESLGLGWLEAVHPDDRPEAMAAWERTLFGQPLDMKTRIYHRGERRYRHFRTRALPARDEEGHILEWLGTSTDVDDMLRLQQHQGVLVAELQHRTRNLMAVVHSVTRRTLDGSDDLDAFERVITDRLAALARVQGLLSRREGLRISFDVLLREELSAHVDMESVDRAPRVTLDGPFEAYLRSATVQTLAMALHELATNAVKYGAFAVESGHLHVRWRVEAVEGGEPVLCVDWRETGVPHMPAESDPPRGGGYGRELILRALPYQLGAETSYRFNEDGVQCVIRVPIAAERLSTEPGDD